MRRSLSLVLALIMCVSILVGCGNNSDSSAESYPSITYEEAPATIYSTTAEENGLGDTNMYVIGIITKERFEVVDFEAAEIETSLGTIVISNPLGIPSWDAFKETTYVKVSFIYLGYSSVYDAACGTFMRYDEMSKDDIDWETAEPTVSPSITPSYNPIDDYNEYLDFLNIGNKNTMGNLSYTTPANWVLRSQDEENTFYNLPDEKGLFMLSVYDYDGDSLLSDDLEELVVTSSYTSDKFTLIASGTTTAFEVPAYRAMFSTLINGENMNMLYYKFVYKNKSYIFLFGELNDKDLYSTQLELLDTYGNILTSTEFN